MEKAKTARKFRPIPLSKATNAYDLMKDVCRDILRAPRRIRMGTVQSLQGDPHGSLPDNFYAGCGAAGCAAGWVAFERGVKTRETDTAERILGKDLHYNTVCSDESLPLLKGRGWGHDNSYVFNAGVGDVVAHTYQGTKEHAEAVVERLKRFMQINEVALKARKLKPVTKRVRE